MKIHSPTLFIEINKTEYAFTAGYENELENFKIIYKCNIPIQGIENNRITDFELSFKIIKENIYLVEQKLNYTFKDVILILDNFSYSFVNLCGFKKLNGSQILKEDITYILNSLKSNINKTENKRTIIHIFNLKFILDKKEIENLPIGLFGDFYSHELSFCLLNGNDHKNLENIFNICNLKIKKILLKSFITGSYLSNKKKNINTFFQIEINNNNSKIIYLENDALKFEENFNFGSDIVIKDISKITSLKIDTVKNIIKNAKFSKKNLDEELIEKKLLDNENYRKIKKKLLNNIATARIQEIVDIMIIKNINLRSYDKNDKLLFLKVTNKDHSNSFQETYRSCLLKNSNLIVKFMDNITNEDLAYNANKLVNFGWKKEAIPVTLNKKSLIARLFDVLFG